MSNYWNSSPYNMVIQQLMREAAQKRGQNPQNPLEQPTGVNVLGEARGIGGDVVGGAKLLSRFTAPEAGAAPSTANTVAGNIGSIGGRYVIPALGAAYSGYQFLKDRGTLGSNVMNGVGTGASIGTMVMPGIGTAVGAGIGAAAGGIKSLINHYRVPLEELEGRQSHDDIYSIFNRMASDQEKQEAQNAVGHGWDQANTPLSLIVMRDQLIKAGASPEEAVAQSNIWGKNLYDSEKGGQAAMSQAFSPIDQFFNTGQYKPKPTTTTSTTTPPKSTTPPVPPSAPAYPGPFSS